MIPSLSLTKQSANQKRFIFTFSFIIFIAFINFTLFKPSTRIRIRLASDETIIQPSIQPHKFSSTPLKKLEPLKPYNDVIDAVFVIADLQNKQKLSLLQKLESISGISFNYIQLVINLSKTFYLFFIHLDVTS